MHPLHLKFMERVLLSKLRKDAKSKRGGPVPAHRIRLAQQCLMVLGCVKVDRVKFAMLLGFKPEGAVMLTRDRATLEAAADRFIDEMAQRGGDHAER